MALDDLDSAAIARALEREGVSLELEVLATCTSTNSVLLERAAEPRALLLIADEQRAGRGRRGRQWLTQRGAALTFSLRWQFRAPAQALRGLSLAAGVALARALRELGARAVGLKWPNDLLVAGSNAKLGGILVETHATAGGTAAIIGVGLNYRTVPALEDSLMRRIAALEELLEPLPRRDMLAARLAAELVRALRAFETGGLAAFSEEWESLHAFRGQYLSVSTDDGLTLAGTAEGIAADGALLLRTGSGVHSIYSGSVVPARTA
ncbi:MAG: biotin--[acetyl-CoA-carboxylase] ligase [Betaproteobacteria bacterium]|nr:biotin--[acetyl-CoA-carboxylase] ligase [Betaproteobacteria bacterium]